MKKIIMILLSVALLLQLCACNQATPQSGSQTVSQTVSCPSCSSVQSANASFCQNCGSKLSSEIACVSCGKLNAPDAAFCGGCGNSLTGVPTTPLPTEEGGSNSSENGNSTATGTAACYECANSGLDDCAGHDCLVCGGSGYTECYANCRGGCSFCDDGYVDCVCDNGKMYYGSTSAGVSFPTEQDCSACEGGYVTCPVCQGSGKSGTYTVGGFDGAGGTEVSKTCNRCFGAKKVSCSVCYGSGTL